jgi:integrase
MAIRRKRRPTRVRVGRVSYYQHHGSWHVYYREGSRQIRRWAGDDEQAAAQTAAQINAQLAVAAPTLFSFTPLSIAELRRRWLDYHEDVLRSSLATISRYRAATQHLENFSIEQIGPAKPAHQLDGEQFVRYLRNLRVPPNGHPHTARRPLRDKGIRFVLETCRAMYGFAAKKRHLPPYGENPFAGLGGKKFRVEDAKPVFVFDAESELAFLKAADAWSFPIHFTLAKTGLRPGEAIHLLVEDLDLDQGWMFIRNKPELGWTIKTGRERAVPLADEQVAVLKQVLGSRRSGPVFRRERFSESECPLAGATRRELAAAVERRVAAEEAATNSAVPRSRRAAIARTVWRDAGATKADRTRHSFIRTAAAAGLTEGTCPKSWRHTFATLLQDANVDPLIRQITLGHAPAGGTEGALGMTSRYSHSRPETVKREIERALRRWPESLQLALDRVKRNAPTSATQ